MSANQRKKSDFFICVVRKIALYKAQMKYMEMFYFI